MKMKKMFAVITSIALLGICVAGCGAGNDDGSGSNTGQEETSEKPEKISIICCTDDVGYLEYIADQYKDEYGIEVELISQSYDDTKTKITTGAAGGNADIAFLDVIWPAEFAANGLILPLDSYYTDEMREEILPGNIEQMTVNNQVYGVPFANNGCFMYYNKAMLEEAGYDNPPETWDELKAMSQDMQEKGICKYGIAWPGMQAEGAVCNMSTLLYSFGGEWTDGNGNFTFNSDAGNQAVLRREECLFSQAPFRLRRRSPASPAYPA